MKQDLNEMAARVHAANIKWWQDVNTGELIPRNIDELLMLTVTELAEAVEGERKDLMDDKLPHRKMAEVEMADAYIRILDLAGGFNEKLTLLDNVSSGETNRAALILEIVRHVAACRLSIALAKIRAYCTQFDYDLHGAIEEKLAFNKTRADHTHEVRRVEGGKKF
jgi:NTP pyrophosphatase (non-canonical NTP hydrolase)